MSEKTKELVVQESKTELYMDTNEATIKNLIYVIRGQQVMLDSDLAELYQVETKVFNQAVKRNMRCMLMEKKESVMRYWLRSFL